MNMDPTPNDEIFEIDLSQDDSLEPIETNDQTNAAAAVQEPAVDTKTKDSNAAAAPKPKRLQSLTPAALFNRRQRTRSIGIRHKVRGIVERGILVQHIDAIIIIYFIRFNYRHVQFAVSHFETTTMLAFIIIAAMVEMC